MGDGSSVPWANVASGANLQGMEVAFEALLSDVRGESSVALTFPLFGSLNMIRLEKFAIFQRKSGNLNLLKSCPRTKKRKGIFFQHGYSSTYRMSVALSYYERKIF